MPRLSKEQLDEHRAAFEKWQTPDEMLTRARAINDDMGAESFFNQPGLQFARDAWSAAKFGIARGVKAIRLSEGQFPDFEIRTESGMEGWEVTEADVDGRQRGLEYRQGKYRNGDYLNAIKKAPAAIRRVCAGKVDKSYSEKVGLLILLNIPSFGASQEETVESFASSTSPAKDVFREVCILWNDRTYPVWLHGEPA